MKKIKVTDKGFYGCYWPVENSEYAIIGMFGDDTEDLMAKSAVKWLQKMFKINVLTLSPNKKDYGHHNLPIERFGSAIDYLKSQGNKKIGICGASTTAMLSLLASSYYPEITLTIALTPCDFIMEGFYQGNKDGRKEWPGDNESTVTWNGNPLPYLPYAYRHPEYWDKVKEESKTTGNMIASKTYLSNLKKLIQFKKKSSLKLNVFKENYFLLVQKMTHYGKQANIFVECKID